MNVEVAIPKPIPHTFSYRTSVAIPPGTRVIVPFRASELVGVVIGPSRGLDPKLESRLKPVIRVVDPHPVFSQALLDLAQWLAEYYMHPLGDVLRAMLPASIEKTTGAYFALTEAGRQAIECDDDDGSVLGTLFTKKSRLTPPLFRRRVHQLEKKSGSVLDPEQWQADGLIALWDGSQTPRASDAGGDGVTPSLVLPSPHDLTAAQREALAVICGRGLAQIPERPFLLRGVTGSGKTEIFLRLIAHLTSSPELLDAQALVLVPEISLTPQITSLFTARFPGAVAVVHSALADEQRWFEMERVRTGAARILIGPRSAVFAPFKRLRLIIVDEEHDSSYKQTSGLHYNGRDVAVLRARIEQACVVLASATPSLESVYNASIGKYDLIELPHRASGQSLPEIQLLACAPERFGTKVTRPSDVATAMTPKAIIDPAVVTALRDVVGAGCQAMVIVNRRGYSYFLYSPERAQAVTCPNCSISLTVHARNTILRCHYCDYRTTVGKILSERPGENLYVVGYGTEQAADILAAELPEARIARLDSDAIAKRGVLEDVLTRFRAGGIDILVGTQILAKGHDFPNVTLIAILEVDQTLSLPDFRAGERTFQLMVQAAGRAGRADLKGRVVVQTRRPDHPVIQAGLTHDFAGFCKFELGFRKNFGYPPFGRMVAIEMSALRKEALDQYARSLEQAITQLAEQDPERMRSIQILGPSVPPLEIIRRRHRRTLVLHSAHPQAQKQLVRDLLNACPPPTAVRVTIDVDPQSLI